MVDDIECVNVVWELVFMVWVDVNGGWGVVEVVVVVVVLIVDGLLEYFE